MGMMGRTTLKQAEIYTRKADRKKLADSDSVRLLSRRYQHPDAKSRPIATAPTLPVRFAPHSSRSFRASVFLKAAVPGVAVP